MKVLKSIIRRLAIFRKTDSSLEVKNVVPKWIKEKLKSSEYVSVKSAKKMVHFIEEAPFNLSEDEIAILYELIEEKEHCKLKASFEYPHIPTILQQVKAECRNEFYRSLETIFSENKLEFALNHFQNRPK